SRRSDVYSLGAMLYHLLTGRPPLVGEALTDTLEQVLNAEPVSPRLLNPSLPRDLETICLKCLEKETDKRYATAQMLADELGRCLNNEPVRARPVTRAERMWRWCRRKPALAGFIVATALLLLGILIGSPIATYRINQALNRAEAGELMARRNQYASDMNLAHQAVKDDDFFRAGRLLDSYRPSNTFANPARRNRRFEIDLRDWEWRYLWKQCQGEQLFILGSQPNGVCAMGFLYDGNTVYSAGSEGTVRFWDLESRRAIGVLSYSEKINGAAASPDGCWLATTASTRAQTDPLCLWDLTTRQSATVLRTSYWLRPRSVRFSTDSKWLAFASYQRVHVWDVDTRREIANQPATYQQTSRIGIAFSPDSRLLAFNKDEYGTIFLWDIVRNSSAGQLQGHESFVMALAFSPDGQTLASGGQDRTAR